jgi:hypothetical protein
MSPPSEVRLPAGWLVPAAYGNSLQFIAGRLRFFTLIQCFGRPQIVEGLD